MHGREKLVEEKIKGSTSKSINNPQLLTLQKILRCVYVKFLVISAFTCTFKIPVFEPSRLY